MSSTSIQFKLSQIDQARTKSHKGSKSLALSDSLGYQPQEINSDCEVFKVLKRESGRQMGHWRRVVIKEGHLARKEETDLDILHLHCLFRKTQRILLSHQ